MPNKKHFLPESGAAEYLETLQESDTRQSGRRKRPLLAFTAFLASAGLCATAMYDLPRTRSLAVTAWRSLTQSRTDTITVLGPPQQAIAPPAAQPAAPAPAAGQAVRGTLAHGDKLRVTFFERVSLAADADGMAPARPTIAVFPRMDLSGDYAIDDGGALSLPRLGTFAAAGRAAAELQAELMAAFERSLGRGSDVRIEIVERLPVYIIGKVRAPGTLRHMPGMIALQAVAHAGGTDLGSADISRSIEALREAGRLQQAEDRLARLSVRHARLVALRDGHDIRMPDDVQARLRGRMTLEGLAALVEAEAATLQVERLSRQQRLALADRQVGIARTEIEAVRKRGEQVLSLLVWKTAKLRELEQVASRGHLPHFRATEAGVDVADVSARFEDNQVVMAQAERRLLEAEIARARVELDYSIEVGRQVFQTTQDIDDCLRSIEAMRSVEQVLRTGAVNADGFAAQPRTGITITRRGEDGFVTFPAQEATPLLPGDVVRVNSEPEAEVSTAMRVDARGPVRREQAEAKPPAD